MTGPTSAVSAGADSFRQGIPRKDFLYAPDADEREEWLKGWGQAAAGERLPEADAE